MKNESYIIELFKSILPYKWSIIFFTIIAVILAKFYLYFIPSTYESYAIIKVKSNHNAPQTNDLLRNSLNNISSVGVKQEIVSLQTFKSNKKTIEKINFTVQYFQKVDYKTIELYDDLPIQLTLQKIPNSKILGKKIKLKLKENGFTLQVKEKAESPLYPFDKEVKTLYFTGTLNKLKPFSKPLYLVFNGNKRQIYEYIVKSRLKAEQIDQGANLIRISFQDTIPKRANRYVNLLIEDYILQSVEKKETTNKKVLSFLDQQLANIKTKLEKSESELERYKSVNSVEPSVKSRESFDKLSVLDLELSELALKEKLANNLVRFIQSSKNLDAIGPTLLEFNDNATIKFIDSLGELQERADELSLEYTENYPELIKLRKRIKRIKYKILLNVKNLNSTLVSKRQNLEAQKSKYELILKELPQKEKKLVHFQRDYEVNAKMYTYLLEKKSENELIKVAAVSNYEIVDKAYSSPRPIKPKRLVFLIVAAIIGFMFGLFLALLRANIKKAKAPLHKEEEKSSSNKELTIASNKLPIYGIIPLYENNNFSTVKLKEAYHQIATNIEFSKKQGEGHITLISSAIEGEGKTTTVVNLAGVFQNLQHKTLVIDFNMRRPSLHGHFGIEQQYSGMSTYLSQRDNIGNIIFSTNYENLDIIPAGPIPPNPSELILSPRLGELFEVLKNKYDYIIIDTANYSKALETLYLMKFTNINLVVLRENFSKETSIGNLESIIAEKNLENVGMVLKSIAKENQSSTPEELLFKKDTPFSTRTPLQLTL